MTDIVLRAEQVSLTNAANDQLYYLSTNRKCKKSAPLILQPLTHERANSLDVHHDIPADLANSRTCGSAQRPTSNVTSFPEIVCKILMHVQTVCTRPSFPTHANTKAWVRG